MLNPLDCISPAFARTKLVLFSPFRVGRSWKLSFTAYLATTSSIFMPVFLLVFLFLPQIREAGGSIAVTLVTIGAIVATLLTVGLFFLVSRLRFAYFDITLNKGEFVAPAWRRYGPQSFRWSLFKMALGTLLMIVVAAPMAGFFKHFYTVMSSIKPGQQPPPDLMFSAMSGYFLFYLLFWVYLWASSLMSDFIVPSLALENTTIAEAFRRFGMLMRREPGQFTGYALMKLVLAAAAYMGMTLALEIGIVLVGLIVGLVLALIGFLLHLAGVPMPVLLGIGIVLLIAFYFFAGWVLTFGMGAVLTFLEAYALYFLGGRYPMLGELLAASTPAPPARGVLYPEPYPPYVPPPAG